MRGPRVLTVGALGDTLKCTSVKRDGFRQVIGILADGKEYSVDLPLVGAYQVENALVAAGLAIARAKRRVRS